MKPTANGEGFKELTVENLSKIAPILGQGKHGLRRALAMAEADVALMPPQSYTF